MTPTYWGIAAFGFFAGACGFYLIYLILKDERKNP